MSNSPQPGVTMASCEKCWNDAHQDALSSQCDVVEIYHRLVAARECAPEEQAGPHATLCVACGRIAVHRYASVCMACGRESK